MVQQMMILEQKQPQPQQHRDNAEQKGEEEDGDSPSLQEQLATSQQALGEALASIGGIQNALAAAHAAIKRASSAKDAAPEQIVRLVLDVRQNAGRNSAVVRLRNSAVVGRRNSAVVGLAEVVVDEDPDAATADAAGEDEDMCPFLSVIWPLLLLLFVMWVILP